MSPIEDRLPLEPFVFWLGLLCFVFAVVLCDLPIRNRPALRRYYKDSSGHFSEQQFEPAHSVQLKGFLKMACQILQMILGKLANITKKS